MKFNIIKLKPTDYEEVLSDWWKDWRWPPPPKNFLPENGTGGLMVYDENTPVVAGFIYNTNSDVAWADWIISNFKYKNKKNRKEAIELLLNALENTATNMNKKFMYALVKNQPLIETYKKLGYNQGDSYSTELIKRI
jgi:hypothetical protein|tara:strand:- start:747 stop:1157 length:411 start_codon:yes stop_codon:yes gene_type:complete